MDRNLGNEYVMSKYKSPKPTKTLFFTPVYVKRSEREDTKMRSNMESKTAPPNGSQTSSKNCEFSTRTSKNCELSTQTSKTIIELAKLERSKMHDTKMRLQCDYKRYSVDSLRSESEVVNRPELRVAESLAAKQLREVKDERLQQWVEQVKTTIPDDYYQGSSVTDQSLITKVGYSKPVHKANKLRALSSSRITSFHNLINLRKSENDLYPVKKTDYSGRCRELCLVQQTIQDPLDCHCPRRKPQLETWHSQIQHGPLYAIPSDKDKFDGVFPLHADLDNGDCHLSAPWTTENLTTPKRKKEHYPKLRSRSMVNCMKTTASHVTPPLYKNTLRASGKNLYSPRFSSGLNTSQFFVAPMTVALSTPSTSNNSKHKCDVISFMSPTLSSEQKSLKQQVDSVKLLMGCKFKGRSSSPNVTRKSNDYMSSKHVRTIKPRAARSEDLSYSQANKTFGNIKISNSSSSLYESTSTSCDNGIFLILSRIKSQDFNVALTGLAEIIDMARVRSSEMVMSYMTLVNQRLLQLLKSPRSHVARTSCQLAGHFFEVLKDTRRPEFDDIVNTLLYKTADANKFIRQDANIALDSMVTHIPTFHAVRSLCSKGPTHRNPLVRCAAVRLLICAIAIAGPTAIMHQSQHEATRRRIIENLIYFLDDKNSETRKYADRLHNIMYKEGTFDYFMKRYLNRTKMEALVAALKNHTRNSS